ncbi:MAG: TIGR04282 family arsenosugar biosynthesis glycosyltransferase [Acidibrevibacterium sp.]|uniref:TIGR04282 family arsenosugar biosynthesis glycosyltransferase n=1 Tax=Acidibrevibacterium sp. TaxID=2606776 RepID=UPI003CFFE6AC
MAETVLIFARAPRLGTVKRRLAAGIGVREALRFHRAMLFSLARRLRADRRVRPIAVITPDRARVPGLGVPGLSVPRIGQGVGDLGVRMARAIARFPRRRVYIIGCDIPGIGPADILAARRALGRAEAVFGPAEDGGYWLVGLGPRRPARLFAGVRWSTPDALADTLANFVGRRVAFLSCRRDIDTVEDLWAQQMKPPSRSVAFPAAVCGARGSRQSSGYTKRDFGSAPSQSP